MGIDLWHFLDQATSWGVSRRSPAA
jgi:hypothetical protein